MLGTPTQILDHEHVHETITFEADSQLSETQRNEFSTTSTNDFTHDIQDLQLPDTQSNTRQFRLPLLSPAILTRPAFQNTPFGDADLLLPDSQRNNDVSETNTLAANSSSRVNYSAKDLTDTQFSAADAEVRSLADIRFLKAGTDLKCCQTSPAKEPFNKMTCRERKRIVVSNIRPPALTKAMCQWVDNTNYLLDPF